MNLHSRNLLLKAVFGGLFLLSSAPADAGCHGHSGGRSYGGVKSSYGGYSSHVYSSPSYHQPTYTQPHYVQPMYSQPVYSQPVPVQPQPAYGQVQQPQFGPGQQSIQSQPGSLTQPTFPTAVQPVQSNMNQVPQTGGISGGQIAGSTQTGAVQPFAPQVPGNGTAVNSAPVDPQQSALQALGGFAPPQAAIQPATTVSGEQSSMAGSWTANLPNGARVQLMLQADGNFAWTALNKDGQSSVFQGSYAIENGGLSLTRSNDGQKLQGSITLTGANTFSFKLSAAQSSSLDFVRP
ncbi:MAG: hypothetical protein WCO86_10295 [Planctomycetota bacterium]